MLMLDEKYILFPQTFQFTDEDNEGKWLAQEHTKFKAEPRLQPSSTQLSYQTTIPHCLLMPLNHGLLP